MKRIFTLFVSLLVISCAHTPEGETDVHSNWEKFTHEFLEQDFKANPEQAARSGRHEFDGMLPDFSPEALKAESQRLMRVRAEMVAFPDDKMNDDQKFQRQYLIAAVDRRLFWRTKVESPFVNPAFYSGALSPATYVVFNYAPPETRMRAIIRYAKAVPSAVAQVRSNLRTPLALPLLEQGELVFKGLSTYLLNDIPKAFADVANPQLQAELKATTSEASQAFMSLHGWLESQRASAVPTYALGAEKFQQMLSETEAVTIPVAQIEADGREDMAKNLARLKAACAKFAPGKSVAVCVNKEESKKSSQDMLTVARQQLTELEKFVADHNVATIPSPERALVDWSPPFMRWNTAFIMRPGIFDKGLPATYYISPPDPKWSEKEQKAYLRSEPHLLIISAHEVWPGHFLDGLVTRTLPPPAGMFGSYAASEGWAHYTEEMMVEAGLRAGDPQVRIAQALEALLRDVRLLSAIGLHTGTMTQKESEKLFAEKAFADPGTAKQQAARGVFDPGYLSYTLGKLMIRKLRDDWCAPRGGTKAWKEFHDKFLLYGDAPIPLVRKAMMGT